MKNRIFYVLLIATIILPAVPAFALNLLSGDLISRYSSVLHTPAETVASSEFQTSELAQTIHKLRQVMLFNLGDGIAAPQIGISKQIAVVMPTHSKLAALIPFRSSGFVIINPVLTVIDAKPRWFIESCLSLANIYRIVARAKKIHLDYLDEDGQPQSKDFSDYTSTIIQHEVEHLNGVLFPERADSSVAVGAPLKATAQIRP